MACLFFHCNIAVGFASSAVVKNLSAMQESQKTWVPSLRLEDPLEKEMATLSSTPAWEIPWTESLVGYSPWGRKSWTQLKWLSTTLLWIMPVVNQNCSCELPLCLAPLRVKFLSALFLSTRLKQWSIYSSMDFCLNIKKQERKSMAAFRMQHRLAVGGLHVSSTVPPPLGKVFREH